jgi:hypothetical protein
MKLLLDSADSAVSTHFEALLFVPITLSATD